MCGRLTSPPGSGRELGKGIDNRQGRPRWSPDGNRAVLHRAVERKRRLYRLPAGGGEAERIGPSSSARQRRAHSP